MAGLRRVECPERSRRAPTKKLRRPHKLAPMKSAARIVCVLLAGITILSAAPQQQSLAAHPIDAIHVTGHKRYSVEQVTRVSGLTPGKSVTVADLDALISRMATTGLFAKIGYKYAGDATGTRLVVTFEIEEPEWKVPVLFDNFVWLTDEQLSAALADDVPTFDGTLPQTEGVQALVVQSLQRHLKSRGIDGTVEFMTYTHVKTKTLKFLFRVTNPSLPLCALRLDGVSAAWEKRFAPAIAAQIGRDYSRVSLEGLTIGEMEGTYRSRGRLDASVGAAVVRLNEGCQGVSVTIPVTEGADYTWERTSWTGNVALPAADLDRLLGVRVGATAETAELDGGLTAVRAAYGTIGHVQAQLTPIARGDKATARAHLEVQVAEGPQFRMGTIVFTGLTDADAADLAKRWKLKPGQIFDASVIDEFRRSQIAPLQQRRRLMARGPIVTADVRAQVVNVRYEFRPPQI